MTVMTPNLTGAGDMLKRWRQVRRISQMDLAADAGVSTRHLSFVETGRAQPSQTLLLRLADVLMLPLRHRNALLLAAGYAPLFPNRPLTMAEMQVVQQTVQRMLQKHEPYPAVAVNMAWDILQINAGYEQVVGWFVGADWRQRFDNVYRLIFAADGLRPYISNWPFIAQFLLNRLHAEAISTQNEALNQLYATLSDTHQNAVGHIRPLESDLPVLDLTLQNERVALRFFGTVTTFGTPLDVTVQELRIESLFPTDEKTRSILIERVQVQQDVLDTD